MSIPFGHHQLHNRYTFDGMLELITPLRISSGYASDTTDAPFMQGYDGAPYIPGSSLRGAIRSEVERILVAVGKDAAGIRSCTLFEKDSCDEKIRKCLDKIKKNEEPPIDDKERGRNNFPNYASQLQAAFVRFQIPNILK